MADFLNIDFFNNLPLWVYISSGFGLLLLVNSCCLCCYSCKYKKKLEQLKYREFELEKKELDLQRRIDEEKRRKQKELEYDGIVLSKPALYSEKYSIV